jgi:hypothetical protein
MPADDVGGPMKSSYALGRELRTLEKPFGGKDCLFASQRLDGEHLDGSAFEHCTFANISFKEAELHGGRFVDCTFVDCYFRKTIIKDCSFSASRFVDCEFPKVEIQSCDLRYVRFRGCCVDYSEVDLSMPSEPNLCQAVASNLAREAEALGQSRMARKFRLRAIRADEQNLRAAVAGSSSWYREHYRGGARVRALWSLGRSYLNRVLWGYGESTWKLVLNTAVVALVVFPLAFLVLRGGLQASSGAIGWWGAVTLSFDNLLPVGNLSRITVVSPVCQALASFEAVVGVVFAGLFVTLLFRWIVRR